MKQVIILLCFILTACSDEPEQATSLNKPVSDILAAMPEVNDKNCNDDIYKGIADEKLRHQFIKLCTHRGTFKKSEPLNMKFN